MKKWVHQAKKSVKLEKMSKDFRHLRKISGFLRTGWGIFFLAAVLFGVLESEPCLAQASFGALAEDESEGDSDKNGNKQEEKEAEGKNGPVLGTPQTKKYRYGMEFEARPGGECSVITGTAPIPAEYPEQSVRLIEENFPRQAKTGYRDLKEGGCRQIVFKLRTLPAGSKTEASILLEVTRYPQAAPEKPEELKIPKPSKELRRHLKESPFIETENKKIRAIAKKIDQESEKAWDKASAALGYVRENIQYKEAYKEKEIRGAKAALDTGEGDCEDMCALFIAIVRNMDIPARTVRVPEHCWAEIYLEDADGAGYWFPAQVAGSEPLGVVTDLRPILQKGDAYNVPEEPKETTRYVKELFKGTVKQNGPDPKVQFIQEEAP